MIQPKVIIVGAGLAGLSCARRLHESNVPFLLLEANDRVGGRVRTDVLNGFRLDHGFQVLLTAYPECQRQLDYTTLNLCSFFSGAQVRWDGVFHRVADPWRNPLAALRGLFNPIGTIIDKCRVGRVRRKVLQGSLDSLWRHNEVSTEEYLREAGFSPTMVDRFFRPFLGGIFLEKNLATSSLMFEFIFRMMALGDTAIPAEGMEAIPRQLAKSLPVESLRPATRVEALEVGGVRLSDGEFLRAKAVVLAVEGPSANRLLGMPATIGSRSVHGLYFSTSAPPFMDPILFLNGEGKGPINNACVLSNVAPSYAPPGKGLISVSALDEDVPQNQSLEEAVHQQLIQWYGAGAMKWRHLRTYSIRHAQPEVSQGVGERLETSCKVRSGVYRCGDYTHAVSIHGAMQSGRLTAEQMIQDLSISNLAH